MRFTFRCSVFCGGGAWKFKTIANPLFRQDVARAGSKIRLSFNGRASEDSYRRGSAERRVDSPGLRQWMHSHDRRRGRQQWRKGVFLTIIIGILILLLAGIAWLVRAYNIQATAPGQPGYQSVLSLLLGAVAGRGIFYYVTIGSILPLLALSANTAFADFPRLCRAIAQDNYLPHSFATRGRRLVYSQGILVLAVLAGLLLILFGGVTDRLIALFAIGAFLAFTLSQAGMVGYWRSAGGPSATRNVT